MEEKLYKLTVVTLIDNPNYDQQLKEYEEQIKYDRFQKELPPKKVSENRLEVVLTEAQWEAVKRSVIESYN